MSTWTCVTYKVNVLETINKLKDPDVFRIGSIYDDKYCIVNIVFSKGTSVTQDGCPRYIISVKFEKLRYPLSEFSLGYRKDNLLQRDAENYAEFGEEITLADLDEKGVVSLRCKFLTER